MTKDKIQIKSKKTTDALMITTYMIIRAKRLKALKDMD
jgi:hypothetical protein